MLRKVLGFVLVLSVLFLCAQPSEAILWIFSAGERDTPLESNERPTKAQRDEKSLD